MDRQVGDGKALLLQSLAGVEHRVVLEGGGDDVGLALFLHGVGRPFDGPVVAFGAAAGKVDLIRVRPQAGGNVGPGLVQGGLGLLPRGVQAGGVAVHLFVIGEHGLQDLCGHSGGGRVVRVDDPVHGSLPFSLVLMEKALFHKSFCIPVPNIHHFSILFKPPERIPPKKGETAPILP